MTGENSNAVIQQKVEELRAKFEARVQAIRKKGAEQLGDISDDAPDPSDFEAMLNLTFDVKWKLTSIKFDVPQFSMERETIKFDVPEVKMKTRELKFDVPATRMKRTCIAKKPEFHGPRIKWTCIYADVPEPYMKRVSIKTDIPEFSSKRMEIKFDKPVVKMDRVEIKLHLPQFYLKKLDAQIEGHKEKIEDVAADMTSEISSAQTELKSSLQSEIGQEIELMFDALRESILKERANVETSYNDAIGKTKSAIRILKENNAVDEVSRLEGELAKLVTDYRQLLIDLDAALEEMNAQQHEALSSLKISG